MIVDNDIGLIEQLSERAGAGRRSEIECNRMLVGIQISEQPTVFAFALTIRTTRSKRAELARRAAAAGLFNFDNLSTKIGKQLAAVFAMVVKALLSR